MPTMRSQQNLRERDSGGLSRQTEAGPQSLPTPPKSTLARMMADPPLSDHLQFVVNLALCTPLIRCLPCSISFDARRNQAFSEGVLLVAELDFPLPKVGFLGLHPHPKIKSRLNPLELSARLGELIRAPLDQAETDRASVIQKLDPRAKHVAPGVMLIDTEDPWWQPQRTSILASHQFPFVVTANSVSLSALFSLRKVLEGSNIRHFARALLGTNHETSHKSHGPNDEQHAEYLRRITRMLDQKNSLADIHPVGENKIPRNTRSARCTAASANQRIASRSGPSLDGISGVQSGSRILPPLSSLRTDPPAMEAARIRMLEQDLIRRGMVQAPGAPHSVTDTELLTNTIQERTNAAYDFQRSASILGPSLDDGGRVQPEARTLSQSSSLHTDQPETEPERIKLIMQDLIRRGIIRAPEA